MTDHKEQPLSATTFDPATTASTDGSCSIAATSVLPIAISSPTFSAVPSTISPQSAATSVPSKCAHNIS